MSKKILYTATSDIHINTFHIPYLKWLKSQGFNVHVAIEKRGEIDLDFCDQVHYLSFKRFPFNKHNVKAYKDLKKIINLNNFDLIHCHTPVVSVLTRLAAKNARKKNTKVLYTVHGYHFYKGAPLHLWALYYPIEKVLSKITDAIITINREDYEITKNKFWNKETFYIKGIGIDTNRFRQVSIDEKKKIKKKLSIGDEKFILLYVAEFISRKNHKFLLESLPELKQNIPNILVLLAGRGPLLEKSIQIAEQLKINEVTSFLGWRNDIPNLAAIADIGISTSKQEGLGLGLAEEMLCRVPIVASSDRGHKEMVIHGENGYLFEQENKNEFIQYVLNLYNDKDLRNTFSKKALEKANEFIIENSLESMSKIYNQFLFNDND
jgi:glycosyltransferase EpsD